MNINIKRTNPYAILPRYASAGAAGLDLTACLEEPLTLAPGARAIVPTGIAVDLPPQHVGLLFARSGLAVMQGLTLSNGVGVIDCDYRGELQVGLIHLGTEPYTLQPGERIAQLAILPVARVQPIEVEELSHTRRGAGGFGSTGR